MASTFKNQGATLGVADSGALYTAGSSNTATGFTAANWQNTHGSAIYNSMTCASGDAGLLGSSNNDALLLFTSEL